MSFGDINSGPAKDYGTPSDDKGPCWIITNIEGTTVSYAAAPPKIATLVFIKWHRRCTCDLWSALDAEGNLPWHHSGGVFPAGTLQWDTGGPINIALHTGGRDGVIGDDPNTPFYDESADDVKIEAQKWDFKLTTRLSKSGECAEDGKKYGGQAPGCTEGESGGGYCPPTPVDSGFVPCCLDACGVYCNGFGCKEEQTHYGTGNNGGGANNDENCNVPPTKCFQDGTAGIMLSGNDPTEAVRETLSNFINGDLRPFGPQHPFAYYGGDPNSEKNFCKKECDNGGSRGRGR